MSVDARCGSNGFVLNRHSSATNNDVEYKLLRDSIFAMIKSISFQINELLWKIIYSWFVGIPCTKVQAIRSSPSSQSYAPWLNPNQSTWSYKMWMKSLTEMQFTVMECRWTRKRQQQKTKKILTSLKVIWGQKISRLSWPSIIESDHAEQWRALCLYDGVGKGRRTIQRPNWLHITASNPVSNACVHIKMYEYNAIDV